MQLITSCDEMELGKNFFPDQNLFRPATPCMLNILKIEASKKKGPVRSAAFDDHETKYKLVFSNGKIAARYLNHSLACWECSRGFLG